MTQLGRAPPPHLSVPTNSEAGAEQPARLAEHAVAVRSPERWRRGRSFYSPSYRIRAIPLTAALHGPYTSPTVRPSFMG